MKNIKSLLVYILFILIAIAISFMIISSFYKSKFKDLKELQDLTVSDLNSYKDKNGKLIYENNVLQISNFDALKDLKTKDSTVSRLRAVVEKEKKINKDLQTVILLKTNLEVKYKDSIDNLIVSYDSIVNDNHTYYYPTYTRDINMFDKWITGNVKLGKNTFDVNIKIVNDYDVVLVRERKNIFKAYELKAKVSNLNPYDEVKEFITIQKEKKSNKFNVSISAGYGIGSGGFSPIVGITGGYTIINF
jgi:hypothetical protein